ncbi:fumarylacetoacetate hydrolase family protein [Natronococcus occultus]|uniref:Fumarylacetoacetate (FAA) hydrolase family protein n=1 Tax=Natronococcus occultus SP4 TaxID=694430 RepID=L0K0T1_9EURY|nr:fumarylacetoacetate hydrolase family protein [Natronococcus occultus]AGB38892.1 fumarylacetoacetate (FAA) hydrolase family protein [Natronococcus occultus SP4]
MRYYQPSAGDDSRLCVKTGGNAYDLTSANQNIREFRDLLRASSIADLTIDEVTERLIENLDPLDEDGEIEGLPLVADEVWAAGVTYQISEQAREQESSMPDMYLNVYDSNRPEVFFKATPSRVVGPTEDVGIRSDSDWDVPEPELAVVLYQGEIVGYTIGNDMSSRSIEGENPLYLPQAKVYDRCCSIGPYVRSADSLEDPHDLKMNMEISRDERILYEGETSTAEMVRTVPELVDCYTKHNAVPELSVLLTGTSLVPDDGFSLREGDVVDIEIDDIGTLTNSVTTV